MEHADLSLLWKVPLLLLLLGGTAARAEVITVPQAHAAGAH